LEQARVEAIGSSEFKGIQKNLKKKYIRDLKIGNTKKDQNLLIKAFKNVAFEKIVGVDLGEINSSFKNIVKEKLKKDYSNFFIDLKKYLHDQEKYTSTIVKKLDELGLLNNSVNNTQNEDINQNDEDQDNENENNDEQKNDEQTESNIEMQTSETTVEQSVSLEENDDMGEESGDTELDYLPDRKILENLENYKVYDYNFDEIINAEELCDIKELEKLRRNLDQQVFSFQPLIVKIANRLQRKLLAQQNRHGI
jgi:Cobalamin biosynthesis protein CobT (nicotinate-mononucleotide:5, 6-dimethylbenzimidazole phosphoribosyltransferase)